MGFPSFPSSNTAAKKAEPVAVKAILRDFEKATLEGARLIIRFVMAQLMEALMAVTGL